MSEHRQLLLPCSCVGTCGVLGVDDWGEDADSPNGWMVEFFSRGGSGLASLRWRVKTAWRVLLGRDYYLDAVCLDGHGIRKLVDFVLDSPAFPSAMPDREEP